MLTHITPVVTIQTGDIMDRTYSRENLLRARKLRKEMTPWEYKLWYRFLRNLPCHFRRQKPLGNYIVDFYSSSARVVIELDGSGHYTLQQSEKDLIRTKDLEAMNLHVLRICNLDIDRNFSGVCAHIDNVVKSLSLSQLR